MHAQRERVYDLEGNPLHEPPDLELYVAFPDREGKMGEGRLRGKGKATGPAGTGGKRTKTALTLGFMTCCMKEARPCLVLMVLAQLFHDWCSQKRIANDTCHLWAVQIKTHLKMVLMKKTLYWSCNAHLFFLAIQKIEFTYLKHPYKLYPRSFWY